MGEPDFEAYVFRISYVDQVLSNRIPSFKLVPFSYPLISAVVVSQHFAGLTSIVTVQWGQAVTCSRLKITMGALKGVSGYI